MRSRTAEEACCSKALPSPPRLNLSTHNTGQNSIKHKAIHIFLKKQMQQFNASPSLRVKVFRSVRDIILFIFAWLPLFLGLWSLFAIFLLTSSFTTYHLWKHPLVEIERITWYKVTKHDTEILLSSSSSLYTTSSTSKLHFILLLLHQTAQTTFSFWLKYWFWMKIMQQSWVFIQLVSRFSNPPYYYYWH